MRYLMLILLTFILTACGSVKHRSRIKRHITETGIRIRQVPKDSVVYMPRVVYRDTTIVVENRNVLLRTQYASSGKLIRVVCEQKPRQEVEHYTRDEKIDERKKEVERKSVFPDLNMTNIGILFAFLAGLVVVNNLTKKAKS